jgi:hypothetical protein
MADPAYVANGVLLFNVYWIQTVQTVPLASEVPILTTLAQ